MSYLEADLHCHLLPDWDDGPRTLRDSLSMAARAASCGVRCIVATPHEGRYFRNIERSSRDVPQAVDLLRQAIAAEGISLSVVPGAEVMLSVPNLVERAKIEPWLTIGGQQRYMLVEAPADAWSESADKILFELSLCGITPIIAHPERLVDVQKNFRIMRGVVERGAHLQVTARSLISNNRCVRQCCHRLLAEGLVSFVASDAHRPEHLWPTEVLDSLYEAVGEDAALQMLLANPRAVLAGEKVSLPAQPFSPTARKKHWFLSFPKL